MSNILNIMDNLLNITVNRDALEDLIAQHIPSTSDIINDIEIDYHQVSEEVADNLDLYTLSRDIDLEDLAGYIELDNNDDVIAELQRNVLDLQREASAWSEAMLRVETDAPTITRLCARVDALEAAKEKPNILVRCWAWIRSKVQR